MKKQSGFTLIELVMVIVILGILASVAIPKFVDMSGDATTAAKAGMSGAVKSALAISIADLKTFPTVTQLATYVQGQNVTATGTGISMKMSDSAGTVITVPTFTDTTCTTPTSAVSDTVRCVGNA